MTVPISEQDGVSGAGTPESPYRIDTPEVDPLDLPINNDGTRLTRRMLQALMSSRINPGRVAQRDAPGGGSRKLSYLEAWDVRATLVRIFGFGGFSIDLIESRLLPTLDDGRQGTKSGGELKAPEHIAQSTVRLTLYGIGPRGEDVTYTETAVGSSSSSTYGDGMDNAIKSATSDAMKRCAINLGTQFGLSLYAKTKEDVIKSIFEPGQHAALETWRGEAQSAEEERVAEQLARATARQDPNIQHEDADSGDGAVA